MSKQATKAHLVAGAILILLSLVSFLVSLSNPTPFLAFAIFFFGVWGGVEVGRYLEHTISKPEPES